MSRFWLRLGGFLCIFVIGLIDYLVVIDLSLSICYLLPISLATFYLGKDTGFFFSAIAAINWYFAEAAAKTDINSLLLFWNTTVRLSVFLIMVHLLGSWKTAYDREKKLARIDALTKIYNRRCFLEILQQETERASRYRRCLTLAYFDVDNFKAINDRLGHSQGDELLRLIARTVKNSIRGTDTVARLGGDEFALLLPETNYQAGQVVLNRLRQQLIEAAEIRYFDVGFSIGAITFVEVPDSIEKMLEQVDSLMYEVKHRGKNDLEHQLSDRLSQNV